MNLFQKSILFLFIMLAAWALILWFTELLADSPCEKTNERENDAFDDDSLAAKLKQCMENDSLYLNANLSLSDVAAAIATNRTYLSDFLNNQMNVNFNDYVNNYRVQKACDILLEGEYKRLEEVGERCGFNSLTTFRRAFKNKMNTTPIEYKKKTSL